MAGFFVAMLLIAIAQHCQSYHVNVTSIEVRKTNLKNPKHSLMDTSKSSLTPPTFELAMTVAVTLNSTNDSPEERSIPIDNYSPEVLLSKLNGDDDASFTKELALHLKTLKQADRVRFISYLRPIWDTVLRSIGNLLRVGESSQTKTVTNRLQYIPECDCKRKYFYPYDEVKRFDSSCSDEGTHHSGGQKVVSYSLPLHTSPGDYNRTGTYKANILENLSKMRVLYPGYSIRLYTDLPLNDDYCDLLCENEDLFWCDIRGGGTSVGDQSQILHRTWKFLPLGDPSVEIFLSRDIGHPLNQREADAVKDWLRLDKAIHVMRDNFKFHNVAMLGGLWGARNDLLDVSQNGVDHDVGKLRSKIVFMSTLSEKSSYRYKNYDQTVLRRVIFYPKRKDIVAHDSYHCVEWSKFTQVRPFPTRRHLTELAVGKEGLAAALAMRYRPQKCPPECRPSYGQDWEYC